MSDISTFPVKAEYGQPFEAYISLVTEPDPRRALEIQTEQTLNLFSTFSDEEATRMLGTSAWTVKEVIGHLCDAERIFSYRALCISRGDQTPLPGFEENDYVPAGHFNKRSLSSLVDEYTINRQATLALAHSMSPEMMLLMGTANNSRISTRALLRIIVGHERWHVERIKQRCSR